MILLAISNTSDDTSRLLSNSIWDPNDCAICLSSSNEPLVLFGCAGQHYFHQTCKERWLQQSRRCPLCRQPLPQQQITPTTTRIRLRWYYLPLPLEVVFVILTIPAVGFYYMLLYCFFLDAMPRCSDQMNDTGTQIFFNMAINCSQDNVSFYELT